MPMPPGKFVNPFFNLGHPGQDYQGPGPGEDPGAGPLPPSPEEPPAPAGEPWTLQPLGSPEGGPGPAAGPEPPPEPGPEPVPTPEPTNSPLALPGTFATPGTPQASPYRSPAFLQNRVVGPLSFGPGATLFGGDAGFSGIDDTGRPHSQQDEELIRKIVMGLQSRRGA